MRHAASSILLATLAFDRALGSDSEAPEKIEFVAPGHESEMQSLRTLFLRHDAGTLPKATLWDAWLVAPCLATASADSAARRSAWRQALLTRDIDERGSVATHQHASIAHPRGWPFPFWQQGNGVGWHFSFHDTVGPGWRPDHTVGLDGFTLEGITPPSLEESGQRLVFTHEHASITTPKFSLDVIDAPFLQLRARADADLGGEFTVEWQREDEADFPARDTRNIRVAITADRMNHAVIAVGEHPEWRGRIIRLRLSAEGVKVGSGLTLQALFSQYDTRHNVNESAFLIGCAEYLAWTGERDFLTRSLPRMRSALEYLLSEHQLREQNIVRTTWIGHDGRSGLAFENGVKRLRSGHGVGSNYWDLLPFGHDDLYATNYACRALDAMADVEEFAAEIADPALAPPRTSAKELRTLASAVRAEADRRFFRSETGRFAGCIDADGTAHDYGFTFVNLEAIAFGVASEDHARSILDWLDGSRRIAGDTSVGSDIYRYRFGPRATTLRNVDWYGWFWSGPESIPFGGQVQDGGAVLGFSAYDLMARLRIRGADDAWARFAEILRWSDEIERAGGYRAYYAANPNHSLQGCGTPGGLGIDCEFFESALVPYAWIECFLGFHPHPDGSLRFDPKLPNGFSSIGMRGIAWRDHVLNVLATEDRVELRVLRGDSASEVRMRFGAAGRESTHRLEVGQSVTLVR